MFTDHANNEIAIHIAVAARVDEVRERIGQQLAGITARFLGHVVRVKVTADLTTADLIVACDPTTDLAAALAARDPQSVCVLHVGAGERLGSWQVVASETELAAHVLAELSRGLDEGRFAHETRLDDPFTKDALILAGRLEIMSHVQAHWGEARSEYNPTTLPRDRPYYFAVECAPSRGRSFWSYGTVGLSLVPQPSLPDSYVELVAYAPVADQRIADVLFAAASHVAHATSGDPPLRPFDTLDLSGAGLCHDYFVLAPAPETDDFNGFPTASSVRFNLAATSTDAPACRVAFLQVSPVTKQELDAAREDPRSVVEQLARRGARRADGWSALAPRSRWKFWQ